MPDRETTEKDLEATLQLPESPTKALHRRILTRQAYEAYEASVAALLQSGEVDLLEDRDQPWQVA